MAKTPLRRTDEPEAPPRILGYRVANPEAPEAERRFEPINADYQRRAEEFLRKVAEAP